jgi:hypothetical protein
MTVTTAAPEADTTEVVRPGKQEEPRYAEGTEELSAQVLAAREVHGRKNLSDFLGISQSATWRAERNRIHPEELAALRDRMDRIAELPVPKPKTRGNRLDRVAAIVSVAAADKKVTKAQLIEELLGVLAPKA